MPGYDAPKELHRAVAELVRDHDDTLTAALEYMAQVDFERFRGLPSDDFAGLAAVKRDTEAAQMFVARLRNIATQPMSNTPVTP